ncbi:MAG: hypothetical protein C4297_04875 [Gemmataceae bacterium]
MEPTPNIVVELLGTVRRRAGLARVPIRADTLGQALLQVQAQCPGLTDLCRPDGRPQPHVLVNINGLQWVGEPDHVLRPGDVVLVMHADAGG